MKSFSLRFYFISVFFSSIIAFPQINFHSTDSVINHELEHDCLKIFISSLHGQDLQEVLSFCLTHSMSEWNIQSNSANTKFTFDQLRKRNVTSQQLYQWSASIDLIEQYQLFLTTHESSMSNNIFYNCTPHRFGSLCQYEFIYLPFENDTLAESIFEFYRKRYEPTSPTCYVHLECNRDSKSACLHWSEICDGYVHCSNDQIDEKFCGKLQINECDEDEYRCQNGQCISKQFKFDRPNIYECLDGTDGTNPLEKYIGIDEYLPTINNEDTLCISLFGLSEISLVMTKTCDITHDEFLTESKLNDKPITLSNICYFAFSCTFYFEKIILPTCVDICAYDRCAWILNETCPEIIIVPSIPIAFGHVYFGYIRQTDIDPLLHNPEFICYNETLCRGFKSDVELVTINNKTCRRTQDSSVMFIQSGFAASTLLQLIGAAHRFLRHCNTISYEEDMDICNSSLMYRCQNSTKCISIYNLCDDTRHCDYGDDEVCPLINGSCFPIDSNILFKCPLEKRCFHMKKFGDDLCDCQYPDSNSCEDEKFAFCHEDNIEQCSVPKIDDYIESYILFPTVCDGFQELSSILIDGTDHTDETECQFWPCNNTYTRCDGYWNCLDGADEIDCDQRYPLISCPSYHHICVEPGTFALICLPLAKANNGNVDCLGGTDEPIRCRSKDNLKLSENFYCDLNNSKPCLDVYSFIIDNCMFENRDLFLNLSELTSGSSSWSLDFDNLMNVYYLVKFFFSLPLYTLKKPYLTQFSLKEKATRKQMQILIPEPSPPSIKTFEYHFECHRGYPLRLWFNHNQTSNDIICFCPPSYYGRYCQYQNQRVSITFKFQPYSDSRKTTFTIVTQLIDNTTQRTIHSAKQLTYLYIKHCQTKFNFYLTYSTRPKRSNHTYSVHIDIYEKVTYGYRGSLYIPLHFPFLPVHRVSYVLNIPRDNSSLTIKCPASHPCINGQCMKYAENSSNSMFCHCKPGWTGKDCSISYNCSCSSDSFCAGIEVNRRSICICPMNKWGPRCLLSSTICQSSTCLNNGQCTLIDDNLKFFCNCPKGFSGDRCEIKDAEIILSFDEDLTLSDTIFIHFIEVRDTSPIRNGSTFQAISLYQNETVIRWSRPFHIVFAELSPKIHYLISVEKDYNRSRIIRKRVTSSDRCGQLAEYLNDTILNYPLIRRIKYYHLPCQKPIGCFHDQNYFCLCNNFGSQRIANCFEFNSSLEYNCFKLSNCQHGGQCLQDDVHCPQTSRCICRTCSYGSLCQFSSSLFDVSLDGIIGPHIQPNLSFPKQPIVIIITLVLIVIIVIGGFIDGILCFFAFQTKQTRKVGCGYYLIGSTITTLLTSIMLALKFSILLCTQMSMITNRLFLNIQCYSFDYLLQICLNTDKWLNACIAMERTMSIVKGTKFNAKQSKQVAKYMIGFLLLMITTLTIYDPIHRQLVDDDSTDEQKRTWCIVSYSSELVVFNQIVHLFHFFVPFILNIISASTIIILSTKRRRKTHKDKIYIDILREQFQQHRHLLISPIVLVILSLPRLIISFVAGCMSSNSSPSIYLISYLASFIPPMLTFVIFVLPSKLYKEEFRKTLTKYRKTLRQ